MASQVSTSVENTAASASAPSHAGSSCSSTIGSAMSRFSMPGTATRAAMPSSTGANANNIRTAAFSAMPVRSAGSLRAPHDFWISPGEMMKAGARRMNSVHPEPGPAEYVRSPNEAGRAGPWNAATPPTR